MPIAPLQPQKPRGQVMSDNREPYEGFDREPYEGFDRPRRRRRPTAQCSAPACLCMSPCDAYWNAREPIEDDGDHEDED